MIIKNLSIVPSQNNLSGNIFPAFTRKSRKDANINDPFWTARISYR